MSIFTLVAMKPFPVYTSVSLVERTDPSEKKGKKKDTSTSKAH